MVKVYRRQEKLRGRRERDRQRRAEEIAEQREERLARRRERDGASRELHTTNGQGETHTSGSGQSWSSTQVSIRDSRGCMSRLGSLWCSPAVIISSVLTRRTCLASVVRIVSDVLYLSL